MLCPDSCMGFTSCHQGLTNRDLEPFNANLITAMKHREQTNDVIKALSGVVFVQTVEVSVDLGLISWLGLDSILFLLKSGHFSPSL